MAGKYHYLIGILLIGAALAATAIAYPYLPSSIPRHWDIHGVPNGYSPKWTLYVFGPGLMAGTMLFTFLLPSLSPKQFEVESFRSTYLQIMLMTVGMMGYFHAVILWVAGGRSLDVPGALMAGLCLVFILLGNVMGKVRRNFFIGIRTPWTLANERVWYATHRLAAKTFVSGGLVGLALIAIGLKGWPIVALLAGALIPAVYSFIFSKRLDRQGGI